MLDLILINRVYLLLAKIIRNSWPIYIFCAGDVTWVDNMKYLGINFVSSKRVEIDICTFLRKF